MSSGAGRHEDRIADDVVREALGGAVQAAYGHRGNDLVAQALLLLLVRVANTWRSITTLWSALRDDCPETFAVDAGSLLRAMFDAYVQTAFITHNAAEREEQARLYLEFAHVERWKMIQRVFKHDTFLSRHLRASPRRTKGEARAKADYDRVKEHYPRRDGRSVRNTWYPGDLRSLAEDVGKGREYDQLLALFHGCVHSSAFALQDGPPIVPQHVSTLASMVAAGVAKIALTHVGATLDDLHQAVIDELSRDFLDTP